MASKKKSAADDANLVENIRKMLRGHVSFARGTIDGVAQLFNAYTSAKAEDGRKSNFFSEERRWVM